MPKKAGAKSAKAGQPVKAKKRINKAKPVKISSEPKAKSSRRFSRLRGMRDVLPEEYKYWDLVIKKATELARAYDFKTVKTPILESLELYNKSTGKDTDIVAKEMYSFIDKNGDKVALRPELTPSLVRAYIEHGMFNLPQPVKFFTLGPIFRHEKPQAGRYRQSYQFDIEIFGEENPVADFLIILIAYNFFRELQIDVQIQINNIGCQECRPEYIQKLVEYYKARGNRSKLCNDCKKRFTRNPLRLLDCKEAGCLELREEAPQVVDYLCDNCREYFIKVLEYLDELDIPYSLNPYLVRGLDYYNRTVFEVWPIEEEENETSISQQGALGGGGRYDGLVEHMGGRPTPACGLAIGVERTILKIKEKNIPLKKDTANLIFIAQLGDQARRKVIIIFEELRRAGYRVRQAFTKNSLKAQLEEANRIGAKFSLILGQKEVMDETILIRDMDSGIQEVVDFKKARAEIDKRLANGD